MMEKQHIISKKKQVRCKEKEEQAARKEWGKGPANLSPTLSPSLNQSNKVNLQNIMVAAFVLP
jgi:hypothetical protein